MLLKYYQRIKIFTGTHPKVDNSPYSSGLLAQSKVCRFLDKLSIDCLIFFRMRCIFTLK